MFIGGWPFGVDISNFKLRPTADLIPRTFSRNRQYIKQIIKTKTDGFKEKTKICKSYVKYRVFYSLLVSSIVVDAHFGVIELSNPSPVRFSISGTSNQ